LKDLSHAYAKQDGLFLLAFHDAHLVGTAAYSPLAQNIYVLKRFFVHKSVRRTGIGQQLFDALYDRLQRKHTTDPFSLYLSTKREDAQNAQAFYRKNGFRVIEQKDLPPRFPIFYQDDLFMMKMKISPSYQNTPNKIQTQCCSQGLVFSNVAPLANKF
jgi:GNAT superfamily N-acetyltransferase